MAPIVPAGKVVFGMQLPDSGAEQVLRRAMGARRRPSRDARGGARPPTTPASSTSGSVTTSRSRATCRRAMSAVWYDTIATLGLARRPDQTDPAAVDRVQPRLPAPAGQRQVVRNARSALRRSGHRRARRRTRRKGVRRPRARRGEARRAHQRGLSRLRAGAHRRQGRRHGDRAARGAAATATDLVRRRCRQLPSSGQRRPTAGSRKALRRTSCRS